MNQQGASNQRGGSSDKRENYIEWEEYYMALALLTAKRSKDPARQVGACIVDPEKWVAGIGYNGMPIGCSDDEFPWGKNTENPLHNKHLYVCHAEMNAILSSNSTNLKNCKMYTTLFPCNECAKLIIQTGIKEVVYLSDIHSEKDEYIAAKRMLEAAKVKIRQYKKKYNKLDINFN